MVNNKNTSGAARIKYRFGVALLWLGILTWLPFIVLRVAGETPSLFWFLPFHLAGVIGGAHLRTSARKDLGIGQSPGSSLKVAGHGLIFAGILVWAPFMYFRLNGQPVDTMHYLPFHLAGIVGGAGLLVIDFLKNKEK